MAHLYRNMLDLAVGHFSGVSKLKNHVCQWSSYKHGLVSNFFFSVKLFRKLKTWTEISKHLWSLLLTVLGKYLCYVVALTSKYTGSSGYYQRTGGNISGELATFVWQSHFLSRNLSLSSCIFARHWCLNRRHSLSVSSACMYLKRDWGR